MHGGPIWEENRLQPGFLFKWAEGNRGIADTNGPRPRIAPDGLKGQANQGKQFFF
jgi:hypothetical protein